MIYAFRSRIKDFNGPPNQAAAQIMFELAEEEECYHLSDNFRSNIFETLVLEKEDANADGTHQNDEEEHNIERIDQKDFQPVGEQQTHWSSPKPNPRRRNPKYYH